MDSSSIIPLPPVEAHYLEGLDAQHLEERRRERARKLPFFRLYWYRLAMWMRVGNLRTIYNALRLHKMAVEYERREAKMLKALTPEAKIFGKLLKHRLAMLGFSDVEREEGKRRLRKTVRFRFPIYITPERIYYQVLTSSQRLIGTRSELPYRASATKLVEEETVRDLSYVLNRQVEAVYRPHKGLWFIVHRTKDTSGVPPLVRFDDMLPYFEQGQPDICLGVSEHRRVEMARLGSVPHALIGGSTRSGKSVFLNNLICGLIRNNSPAQVKLLLIDLKRVEFFDYFKTDALTGEFVPTLSIPHLVGPVITEAADALNALKQVFALVRQRYSLMAGQYRNIEEYNRHRAPARRMPRLVVIIDEVGELKLDFNSRRGEEVEKILLRIAQLGRAAGIHLILSTQRPSKTVISPNIRAQCDLKLSGRMAQQWDSITILGTGHAANLDNVDGRACFRIGPDVIEVQPPLINGYKIMESVGLAMEMPRFELALPSVAAADALLYEDDDHVLDDESALIKVLTEAGGHLGIHTIESTLGLNRADATQFQRRVAGMAITHEGEPYIVKKTSKTYEVVHATKVERSSNGKRMKYLPSEVN